MFNNSYGNNGDFEALARQYWGAWGDAMRQAGIGAAAPAPPPSAGGWQQAMDWWSQLLPKAPSQANDALGRFNQQARDWYGQMQQVAAQFAGRDSGASEISQAWRQALGSSGANPFPEMFKSMSGKGLHGLDDWIEQAKPFLDSIQRDSRQWLHLPAFGQHREHQERLQALAQAQIDYQQRSQAFNVLMGNCAQRAFDVFESKLAAREEPGRQITSARGLFDLWIDAAEEAYGEIALSPEFRQLSGALTNAQMRLRAGLQKEVELMGAQFGMPTRTEVDSAHRKIAELERSVRRAAAAAEKSGASRKPEASDRAERVAGTEGRTNTASNTRKRAPSTQLASKTGGTAQRSGARKTAAAKKVRKVAKKAARKVAKTPVKKAAKNAAPSKAAARKRVTAPAKVEKKREGAPKSGTTASRARGSAAAPASPKTAARKAAGKTKAARGKTLASTAGSAKAGSAASGASMKEWVARNKAAADGGVGVTQKRASSGKKETRK